jgi:hypothetical protein
MRRPEHPSETERRELAREGEAFAETLRRASLRAGDLSPWIERAECDIEDARRRTRSRDPRTRAIARRELVYKPVLLERLRAIARESSPGGRALSPVRDAVSCGAVAAALDGELEPGLARQRNYARDV